MHAKLNDDLYQRFRDLLLTRCGLYYPEQKRMDLAHRLNLTLSTTQHQDLAALYADAMAGGPGWEAIVTHLTIGETYFFRNDAQFDALREQIMPDLLKRRAALRTLRFWSAGCATGEEPYSIAILVSELLPRDVPWNASILATDINPVFLARAREALYGNWSFRETPDLLRDRYWSPEQGRWRLDPQIRRMVSFANLNLAELGYPSITNGTSALDVIMCRNVTIYFDEATTRQVAERFYQALTPGGWLIVGHAEPQASVYHNFEVFNFPNTVIYRKPLDAPLFAVDSTSWVGFSGPRALVSPVTPQSQTQPDIHAPAGWLESSRPAPAPKDQGAAFDNQRQRLATAAPPLEPSPADPWPAIAARLARRDVGDVEPLLTDLLELNPTHMLALLALARLYADRADWERAQRHCAAALEQDSLNIPGHYLMAQIHEHQADLEAALAAYRRTVFLDPGFVPGMLGMASVWRQLGRYADAQRVYRNAVQHLAALHSTVPVSGIEDVTAGELLAWIRKQLVEST
jgi:chemotaxis protein methyltransferase CheR